MKLPILIVAVLLTGGCAAQSAAPATARETTVITTSGGAATMVTANTATDGAEVGIPARADQVVTAVIEAYDAVGIPLTTMDPNSRVFGNLKFTASRIDGQRMSTFVSCGSSAFAMPNADSYRVTLAIRTQVVPTENGSSVQTRVTGSAVPRGVSANPVNCNSTGRLEGRLHDEIKRIASEAGE